MPDRCLAVVRSCLPMQRHARQAACWIATLPFSWAKHGQDSRPEVLARLLCGIVKRLEKAQEASRLSSPFLQHFAYLFGPLVPKSTSLRKRYVVEIRFAEVCSGLGSSLGSKDRDRTIVSSESRNDQRFLLGGATAMQSACESLSLSLEEPGQFPVYLAAMCCCWRSNLAGLSRMESNRAPGSVPGIGCRTTYAICKRLVGRCLTSPNPRCMKNLWGFSRKWMTAKYSNTSCSFGNASLHPPERTLCFWTMNGCGHLAGT